MSSYGRPTIVSLMCVVVRNRRRYSRPRPWCKCSSTFGFLLDGSSVGIASQRPRRGRPSERGLTDTDRSRSLAAAGTRDGFFRIVYRFQNEQLVELINRTVHAAALSALLETETGYRFYFGVYVRNVSRFTPFYMALVDPFRRLVVYPSLLRSVRARWKQAFSTV